MWCKLLLCGYFFVVHAAVMLRAYLKSRSNWLFRELVVFIIARVISNLHILLNTEYQQTAPIQQCCCRVAVDGTAAQQLQQHVLFGEEAKKTHALPNAYRMHLTVSKSRP